ncbi:hypothetical protein BH20ACT2_BH20ACT2_13910 [soil metagenome]
MTPSVPESGAGIIRASLAGTALFTITASVGAALPDIFGVPSAVVAGALFVVGCGAFLWAFAIAVGRSRAEAIGVGGLYLLVGSAPRQVQRLLLGAVAAQAVVALVTASVRPFTSLAFGILVPMLGLGLAGLWAARHGTFAAREDAAEP